MSASATKMVAPVTSSGPQLRQSPKLSTVSKNDEPITNASSVDSTNLVKCARNENDSSYFKTEVVWSNVLVFVIFHSLALYGLVTHGSELGMCFVFFFLY